jgi:hypothetical protein
MTAGTRPPTGVAAGHLDRGRLCAMSGDSRRNWRSSVAVALRSGALAWDRVPTGR